MASWANTSTTGLSAATHEMEVINAAQVHFGPDEQLVFKTTKRIFEDFCECLLVTEERKDVFPAFEEIADNGVKVLRDLVRCSVRDESLASTLRQLISEHRAYTLLRKLKVKEHQVVEVVQGQSILTDLLIEDEEFRRLLALLEWCEENAYSEPNAITELYEEVSRLETECDVRAETLHAVKNGEKFCDLDLDGAMHGRLHVKDEEMQVRVHNIVYTLIRYGQISKACEILGRSGLYALVPSLKFREMIHKPSLTPLSQDDAVYRLACSRELFRRTVDQIIEKGCSMSQVERCIWSVVAGRLEPALSLSSRTDDRLWCYLNTAVACRLDAKIAELHANIADADRSTLSANDLMVDSIFDEIATQERSPYYASYRYLVTGDSEGHVEFMRRWLEDHTRDQFPHLLRYMAHIVLWYFTDAQPLQEENGYWILEQYVELLISLEFYELVPFYAAHLPDERAEHVLVTFMYGLNDDETRLSVLSAASKAGISVTNLCRKIFTYAVKMNKVTTEPSESDKIIISAWNWLLFPGKETNIDALIQANFIFRRFFVTGKIEEAKQLLKAFPEVDGVRLEEDWQKELANDPQRRFIADALAEHRGYIAYLDALDCFETWYQQFGCEVPEVPEKPLEEEWLRMDIQQKTAFEVRLQKAESLRQRHLANTLFCFQAASKALNDILLWPGGWMNFVGTADTNPEKVERIEDLKNIRSDYLASVVTMMLSMFEQSEDKESATKLVETLADNELAIAELLPREILIGILRKLSLFVGTKVR